VLSDTGPAAVAGNLVAWGWRVTEPQQFYENPRQVRRYINIINPINSIIRYPIYSNYANKVQTYESIKRRIMYGLRMLGTSPRLFVLKAAQHLKKKDV